MKITDEFYQKFWVRLVWLTLSKLTEDMYIKKIKSDLLTVICIFLQWISSVCKR